MEAENELVSLTPPSVMTTGAADVRRVDGARCIVEGVINTDDIAFDGNIVESQGINFSLHKSNPIVLFNHGLPTAEGGMGYPLPVGLAELENGAYGVRTIGNETLGAAKFDQKNPFAMDLFRMYEDKILRGYSINVKPLAWQRIDDKVGMGGKKKACYRITESLLAEFSATPCPVNPFALAFSVKRGTVLQDYPGLDRMLDRDRLTVALQSGKIGNHHFDDKVLQETFSPFMLSSSTYSRGVELKRAQTMKDDEKDPKKEPDVSAREDKDAGEEEAEVQEDKYEQADEGETAPEKDEKDGEEKRADTEGSEDFDMDDLKPSMMSAINGQQAVRDYRMALIEEERGMEDELGIEAFAQAHELLEQIEGVFVNYLAAKGLKGDNLPKVATGEELRAMCKKMRSDSKKMEAESDVMRTTLIDYRAPRFGILRAAVKLDDKPIEQVFPDINTVDQTQLARVQLMASKIIRRFSKTKAHERNN